MSTRGYSARSLVAGPVLMALVALLFSLGVAAQDPGRGPAGYVPEKVTAVEEVELVANTADPTQDFFYKRYSADTFTPAFSDMEYRYDTGGCIIRTGGGSYDHTTHTVQLPEGAEITYMRLYFYDMDDDHDAVAQLMAYDGQGHLELIEVVASTGTPGWSSVGGGLPFSYIVHNTDEALVLWLNFGKSTADTLRLCGVRIQYKYTLSRSSLPLILNQSNP